MNIVSQKVNFGGKKDDLNTFNDIKSRSWGSRRKTFRRSHHLLVLFAGKPDAVRRYCLRHICHGALNANELYYRITIIVAVYRNSASPTRTVCSLARRINHNFIVVTCADEYFKNPSRTATNL